MLSFDVVAPFVQTPDAGSVTSKFDFAFDLTAVIIKLFFETKGKIEKKLGDLTNIAVVYWPFFIVPINNSRAYVLEGRGMLSDKLKLAVDVSRLPSADADIEEANIDAFVRSLNKHVSSMEKVANAPREDKKVEGFIPLSYHQEYFRHFFKKLGKPYLDSYFSVDPVLTENSVKYIHDEVVALFDEAPLKTIRADLEKVEKYCNKWIGFIENMIKNQERDPVTSLKKQGLWVLPPVPSNIEHLVENISRETKELQSKQKDENLKELITGAERCIGDAGTIESAFDDYARRLKDLEAKIREEERRIEKERKNWESNIEEIKKLLERERVAVRDFEENNKKFQGQFMSERGIDFKTDKVITCGFPIFLLNFQNLKNGRMETLVRAPVLLEEVTRMSKNPFQEPKGYKDFEAMITRYLLKEMSEFELQSNIKNQDMFSLPNLSIQVSNNIDEFLDMGYLKKKTHAQIRDKEIHQLLRKEQV